MDLCITYYTKENRTIWDEFVLNKSMNGTFLHTRRFIEYHPENRFVDKSILIKKGMEVIALVLGCQENVNGELNYISHSGSSFGGIIISKDFYKIKYVNEILNKLLQFLKTENFDRITLKNPPDILCQESQALLEYFLYYRQFQCFDELGTCIEISKISDSIPMNFSSNKRRDYRYSLKHPLDLIKLEDKQQISAFHTLLSENLMKFDKKPVHTINELLRLKEDILSGEMEFYGVYFQERLTAGSMIFKFFNGKNKVWHTQYLASNKEYQKYYVMDFLIGELIRLSKESGYDYFSFGISTEDKGRKLNMGLAQFKEGFGGSNILYKTYTRKL